MQQVRSVQALEMIGTRAAKDFLRELAGGVPNTRLTDDARAAVRRFR